MKKIGLAAVLILCPFGLSASNFRGADQIYIPAAGHTQGASGVFISDVWISNLSDSQVQVSIIYGPQGEGGGEWREFKNRILLGPLERKEFPDFFKNVLNISSGVGQLILNACKTDTSCGPETQDSNGVSPNFRPISAESRVYQIPNPDSSACDPSRLQTGQNFPGIPWYNSVSSLQRTAGLDMVFITGITHTGNPGQVGTFRANIGLVNVSQYSATTMVATLYQRSAMPSDRKREYRVTLGPLGSVLVGFGTMFPGITGTDFLVTVEQRSNQPTNDAPPWCEEGCPAFLAYGSVLDNGSGDATTLEAQYLKELNQLQIACIYSPADSPHRGVRH